MKYAISITLFTFLTVLTQAYSQTPDTLKVRLYADVFYGGPNLVSRLVDAVNPISGNDKLSVSGFGPMGLRADYMLGKVISLGLEVHHASSTVRRSIYQNATSSQIVFQDRLNINRTRIYPRLAAHFGRERLDVYAMVSLGVAFWNADYKIEQRLSSDYDDLPALRLKPGSLIAAFRSSLGFRYMLFRNVGINGDLGLGGPFYTIGLSARI